MMMMMGPIITAMMTKMRVSLDSRLGLGSGMGGLTVTVALKREGGGGSK